MTMAGKTITPATKLKLPKPRKCRAEKVEQRFCDDLASQVGYEVVCFSQPRHTMQTEGIADRRYRHLKKGHAFWFEVKAEDGQLTRAQYNFLVAEEMTGNAVGCGTFEDFAAMLGVGQATQNDYRVVGALSVEKWAAKGFRGEKKGTPL